MTRLTLVAAVAANGVIGHRGGIPWKLPGEQAHFKALTIGHTLLMGRATFESIGRVLPGRRTLVITRDRTWAHANVEVGHSFEEALTLAGPGDEIFVVGGAQIYAQAMPLCTAMVLTHVPTSPEGDTYFPPWEPSAWTEVERVPFPGFEVVTYARPGPGRVPPTV